MALRLQDDVRTKVVDYVTVLLCGTAGTPAGTRGTVGYLRIFGGVQPGTGGATHGTQGTLCAISYISWLAGTTGTAVISASRTGTAGSTGTAQWARLSYSDGTSFIVDGGCGTAATQQFVIDVAGITVDSIVTLSSATIIMPAS